MSMQEDNNAIYILPEQYPITPFQPSQGDPRRRSYPRYYLTGTSSTGEQVQHSNSAIRLRAPNLAVPDNTGYPVFDGRPAPLFQQRYAHFSP